MLFLKTGRNSTIIEEVDDMKDRLEYTFNIIEDWFHSKIEKIQGTWDYMKFIWSHDSYREWDYDYLYALIVFKLQRMEKRLRKDSFVTTYNETANSILEAIHYYKLYEDIEDRCIFENVHLPMTRKGYLMINSMKQAAWDKFHDILKEKGDTWWS